MTERLSSSSSIGEAWGFPRGSAVMNLLAMQETKEMQFRSLGQEDPLEEGMATHSSILAGKIPWTEEPGRIQFMWSQSQRRLSTHAGLPEHMFAGNLKRCLMAIQTRAIQSHDLSRKA